MPNHKPGCDGQLRTVPCGSTHYHKCECGDRVEFLLRPYGCALCAEIIACQPTFGESRCDADRYFIRRYYRGRVRRYQQKDMPALPYRLAA